MDNLREDGMILKGDDSPKAEASLQDIIEAKKKSLEKRKSIFELRADELRTIKEKLKLPDTGTFYYPASGEDNSPRLALPEWEITYLDAVDTKVQRLSNYDKVIKGDLMNPPFSPKDCQFDVAMLVSPGMHFGSLSPEYIKNVIQFIKPNGVLICDNYHGTVDDIKEELGDVLKEVGLDKSGELKVFRIMGGDTGEYGT